MNTATFSIPNRWQEGADQIKSSIEHYASHVGQPFEAAIAGETDPGRIWITDRGTLTDQEHQAAENIVYKLNDFLNRPKGEPWKTRSDAEQQLAAQFAEIESAFLKLSFPEWSPKDSQNTEFAISKGGHFKAVHRADGQYTIQHKAAPNYPKERGRVWTGGERDFDTLDEAAEQATKEREEYLKKRGGRR